MLALAIVALSLSGAGKRGRQIFSYSSRTALDPEVKVPCTHSCLQDQRLALVFDQGAPTDCTVAPDVVNLPGKPSLPLRLSNA